MAQQNDLLKKVGELGFPLLETKEPVDSNKTLAEMVKSKNLRLWEGFPVVLANSLEKNLFNYESARNHLKKPLERSCLNLLVAMSLALYAVLKLKFSWVAALYKKLAPDDKKAHNSFVEKLKKNTEFKFCGRSLNSERLKSTFNNYLKQEESKLDSLMSVKKEFGLEYALSQVFSPKQKELFFKKLRQEKLTKTEKEYFSRVVKKKVLALANTQLHDLSRRLAE